jgi:four helix bundle protein
MNRYELEERLIDFAVLIYRITEQFPGSKEGIYYKDQIIRSSASSALNYGEAMSAESGKDFLHKVRIVLKELRETFVALRIIDRIQLLKSENELAKVIKENNELISIFVKTVQTSLKTNHPNPTIKNKSKIVNQLIS